MIHVCDTKPQEILILPLFSQRNQRIMHHKDETRPKKNLLKPYKPPCKSIIKLRQGMEIEIHLSDTEYGCCDSSKQYRE